jgi:hypothetical protein
MENSFEDLTHKMTLLRRIYIMSCLELNLNLLKYKKGI